MDLPSLPLRMLLSTDGSVTALLEASFRAPVAVETLSNTVDGSRARSTGGRPARSRPTGRPLLRARSELALDRLPAAARAALLVGEEPIGTVLRDARLETRRELVPYTAEPRDRRRRGRARHPRRLARVRAHVPDRQLLARPRRGDRAVPGVAVRRGGGVMLHPDRRAVLGRVARAAARPPPARSRPPARRMLRGGAFKPRTSRTRFQGLGEEGPGACSPRRERDRPADRDRADRPPRDRRRARRSPT